MTCLIAACGGGGDGGTGPNGGDLAGDYQLVGANDEAVPTVVTSDACAPAKIVSGGMTMSNGRWQMGFDWRDNDDAPKTLADHGTFRRDGDELLFTSDVYGDQFEGEIDDGHVWYYYDFCTSDPGEDLDLAFSR